MKDDIYLIPNDILEIYSQNEYGKELKDNIKCIEEDLTLFFKYHEGITVNKARDLFLKTMSNGGLKKLKDNLNLHSSGRQKS